MQTPFIINPAATSLDIQDAIHSTLNKVKAVLTCLMFSTEFTRDDIELDDSTLYHALWVADDLVDNVQSLLARLENPVTFQKPKKPV